MSTDPRVAIVAGWMRCNAAHSITTGTVSIADAVELLARLDAIGDQVERVAKAIHDAEESDTEQWTCEPEGARETYRRLARAAMAAIA